MKYSSFLFAVLLSACASAPEKNAGFVCTHVVLVTTRLQTVSGPQELLQESCVLWERKDRPAQKPDKLQDSGTVYYRTKG
jgi:hypothetical protein